MDKIESTDTTSAPRDPTWRLTAGQAIAAANDNDREFEIRPLEIEQGTSDMHAAIPFSNIDHNVFELLALELDEATLVGDVVTSTGEDHADVLVLLDLHMNPLLCIEKHGDETWLMRSDAPLLGDSAKAIHGSAQVAADEVLDFIAFPRNR